MAYHRLSLFPLAIIVILLNVPIVTAWIASNWLLCLWSTVLGLKKKKIFLLSNNKIFQAHLDYIPAQDVELVLS